MNIRIRIDETSNDNDRVVIHVEHESHDNGVRAFFRPGAWNVPRSIHNHLKNEIDGRIDTVEIVDTVGVEGLTEQSILPRSMRKQTPYKEPTEVRISA